MHKTAILGLMALALLLAPVAFAQDSEEPAEATEGVKWTEDYAAALKTATADKKRLFIEFTATW